MAVARLDGRGPGEGHPLGADHGFKLAQANNVVAKFLSKVAQRSREQFLGGKRNVRAGRSGGLTTKQ